VSDHDRGTCSFVLDNFSIVAREFMQRQTFHRAGTAACAARLRPQHAKAGFGQPCGDLVEILRPAPPPRQQNDQRPATLGDDVDTHIIIGENFARTLGLR
jgi:hypothetical protein